MFNLKPSELYPDMVSESKKIYESKKGYWTLKQYYGNNPYLSFDYWKIKYNHYLMPEKSAIWQRHIHIPLNWYSFYILFIYHHTGKCHKDQRSKIYIGKARENK